MPAGRGKLLPDYGYKRGFHGSLSAFDCSGMQPGKVPGSDDSVRSGDTSR